MYAIIAGTGALPGLICERLMARGTPPVVCEMPGFAPDVPDGLDRVTFRMEELASFLDGLRTRGVRQLCPAGRILRPEIDPARVDAATAPLLARLEAALARGDNGTLTELLAIVEEAGLAVVGAHEILPELLPPAGIAVGTLPDGAGRDAEAGAAHLVEMGRADSGQACVIRAGEVLVEEDARGTDAMLRDLVPATTPPGRDAPLGFVLEKAARSFGVDTTGEGTALPGAGAILFKAPKPGQELRADMPVIGPDTAENAAAAGLSGIVVEAGGVMVLDRERIVEICARRGLFLWVREARA